MESKKLQKGDDNMDKLKALIEVKKLIALLLTIVFCFLAAVGRISSEQFITVFTVVISFYFSQSAIRQALTEKK
jgi:ACR3 family arsenite efflux pump ArsB